MPSLSLATLPQIISELEKRPNTIFVLVTVTENTEDHPSNDASLCFSPSLSACQAEELVELAAGYLRYVQTSEEDLEQNRF